MNAPEIERDSRDYSGGYEVSLWSDADLIWLAKILIPLFPQDCRTVASEARFVLAESDGVLSTTREMRVRPCAHL